MANDANAALLARDAAHLIHPLHSRAVHSHGRVWVRGEGPFLFDANGDRYLDGLSGLWNVTAGHGRHELVAAATRQMSELAFASGYAGSSNPRAIELAERLSAITYPRINRFYFTSGGGEASDSNFKMARYYWKLKGKPEKTKVISRQWAYHGVTLAAMSATGLSNYWPMFEPRVPGFVHIPSPYPYRYEAPAGTPQGIAAADELERAILREGADTVAMFIAEPVQGAGGVIVPQPDYFARVREICDQYEVLLVADEVITGFGRTGKLFALEHWGVEPDMIQFAKGITSGYFPLGGIGISDDLAATMDAADSAWMHAYTYSAHPVGCAVALATLDIVHDEDFPGQARVKGARFLDHLREALSDHPHVGDVRGLGLMCAVEIVEDKSTKEEFAPAEKVGPRILAAALERGLFSRVRGDVFCLAPPITTPEDQLDRIVEALRDAVVAVLG
ncbi:MAG: aspartate aminotransferase family protein [Gammaproteobacteria bacterium]|nr:aspartate aminotransferase family protein [Gammaproteobacteria bacterium]NIR85098.1 aspartate aminotransferase family protein [Gammaproteobacteria bacterium]NIR92008.1 aspartate aminotransferase family protein [Gammaproteobacteria bacterium]NIU06147.1 aspartate aminotransferase family protein [Gammaproteobacteria bacterium]NIV53090.1 aminotransferase class III-fold pyridoxal phosphate-dependent enzyme [Gammaproteobacteria bacterium]